MTKIEVHNSTLLIDTGQPHEGDHAGGAAGNGVEDADRNYV